nr:acyl-CoA/acyl-ACP dehydrogenase [Actinomycetales bacterium]
MARALRRPRTRPVLRRPPGIGWRPHRTHPKGDHVLDDALLARIHDRAAEIDRSNGFPWEDLEDLREAGYFTAMVPSERGGGGLSLREMTEVQMRLAGAAPATALAFNMHQIWVGVANTMATMGDTSADFLLDAAMDREIFAFGVSEPGNDLVLFGSASEARPDGEGGYSFHGTKIFTSGAPAWTMLGTYAQDSTDPENPRSVYAFVRRDGGGFEIRDDWDALGMRGSQSCTTILDGAHAPAERILGTFPPGPGMEPVLFGIFSNFEILVASVYVGIARRALDLAVETVHRRRSRLNLGAPYANDPLIRRRIAEAAIALDGIYPQIASIADDVADFSLERHGDLWYPRLSAILGRSVEVAKEVVEQAVRSAGGSSYYTKNELSRLYRDVLAGLFHPSDSESLTNAWAGAVLGPVLPWPPAPEAEAGAAEAGTPEDREES